MNIARSIGIAALAATFALTGCSTAVDGAAQGASTETVCPDGYILTKIGKCVDATTTTTTSPTAAPNANPTTELPSVSACDGTQCDLTASDDEIDRLVSEALDDVTAMWANLNVTYTLHMYKDGIVGCDVNDDPNATGWVCAKQGVGGWNPTAMRTWASDRGASLEEPFEIDQRLVELAPSGPGDQVGIADARAVELFDRQPAGIVQFVEQAGKQVGVGNRVHATFPKGRWRQNPPAGLARTPFKKQRRQFA